MEVDVTKTRNRIRDTVNRMSDPKALTYLAGRLGVTVAYLPEPNDRPDFGPNQVRHMCELRLGNTYKDVHGDERDGTRTFVVLEEPFLKDGSGWWVKARYTGTDLEYSFSVQDYNILHYPNGTWNPSGWIAFTDYSRHLKHVCCCCSDCPDGHTHSHHHGC